MARVTSRTKSLSVPRPDDRLTSDQVTAEYPIARRTLYFWAQQGRIHTWKLGARNIYSRREIEGLIQPQRRSA